MKDGQEAIVYWKDPAFHRNVSDLDKADFASQVNIGRVYEKKEKILIVNAVTDNDEYEVTVVARELVTRIEWLEKCQGDKNG